MAELSPDDLERRSEDLLANALHYAGLGYPVFPTMPDGSPERVEKAPLTDRGFMDATTNETVIRNWWRQWPMANVAICTAGLVVIDSDPGNTWLREGFEDEAASLLVAPQALTPRGGNHRFFKQPHDREYSCTASRLAPHVDTRANGGYVLASPSRVRGKLYQWVPGQELPSIDELPLPPDWLVMELDRIKRVRVVKDADEDAISPASSVISEGGRNDTLMRIGGGLRRMGLSRVEIETALLRVNLERCVPTLDNAEVKSIAASVARYDPDQVTVALIEDHYGMDRRGDEDEPPARPDPEVPGQLPVELLRVPGLMGRVADFTNATCFRDQPDLAIAGAIALMSVLTGRKIADTYDTRTNLYLFGLAPSGGGKDHARQVNKKILAASSGLDLLGQESFASSQGLFAQVELRGCVLCQVDELGEFLRAIKNPKASHLHGITAELLKLYSSANSVYMGPAYADAKRNKSVDQPHFVFYGTTVSESFFDSMTIDSITGGLLARSIFFEGSKDLQPKKSNPRHDVPAEIIDEVKAWLSFAPGGNLAGQHPQPKRIPIDADAEAIFAEAERIADERHNELKFPLGTIYTRLVEQARKLAILRACSQWGPIVERITAEDAKWGVAVMGNRCERMRWLAERRVAHSDYDALRLKLLGIIEEAGPGGIGGREWRAKTKRIDPVKLKPVVLGLVDSGDVIEAVSKMGTKSPDGKGRPSKRLVSASFGPQNDFGGYLETGGRSPK